MGMYKIRKKRWHSNQEEWKTTCQDQGEIQAVLLEHHINIPKNKATKTTELIEKMGLGAQYSNSVPREGNAAARPQGTPL